MKNNNAFNSAKSKVFDKSDAKGRAEEKHKEHTAKVTPVGRRGNKPIGRR